MRATSRWVALRNGRGGGERVKIERASKRNGYGRRGGRKEEENSDPENRRRKRWGGRARLKSKNKRRSLGPEWSMSKVGTPTPHNSEKPHIMVASINNKQQPIKRSTFKAPFDTDNRWVPSKESPFFYTSSNLSEL